MEDLPATTGRAACGAGSIAKWRAPMALVVLLERKGILTRQDVLAMIQELRQREPTAMPPRYLDT